MASCIVCNVKTESRYKDLYMTMARNRLEKVMEQVVSEDSVICSGCQFDLEQIEMYYCLLEAFKMRYWQAVAERRHYLEGVHAPTSPNALAETICHSTANTPQDIVEGSMLPEASAPISFKILNVRSLQESWQQLEETLADESLVQENETEHGLDLGCWSEGQNELEQAEHCMVMTANSLDEDDNKENEGQYFMHDRSNISDQIMMDDSAVLFDGPPGMHMSTTSRPAGQRQKRKVGKRKKIAAEDLGKPPVCNFRTGPRKVGRLRKNPAGNPCASLGAPVSDSHAEGGGAADMDKQGSRIKGTNLGVSPEKLVMPEKNKRATIKRKPKRLRKTEKEEVTKSPLSPRLNRVHEGDGNKGGVPWSEQFHGTGKKKAKHGRSKGRHAQVGARKCDIDNRKRFMCTICGKGLLTKSYLKLHMAQHTGNLQHRCSVCDKACVTTSALRVHMLVHAEEKPHNCLECGKSFIQAAHFRTHMMLHTGERPFKCECGLTFRENSAMKSHKKSLTHAARLASHP